MLASPISALKTCFGPEASGDLFFWSGQFFPITRVLTGPNQYSNSTVNVATSELIPAEHYVRVVFILYIHPLYDIISYPIKQLDMC
jgi:hypothetical protein